MRIQMIVNFKSARTLITLFGLCAFSNACAPKVYVIDRQTVLEEQAAGDWPDFEKQMLDKGKSAGPVPLSKVPPSPRRARLYNVLNAELGTRADTGAKP